jgi:hypothetical protein
LCALARSQARRSGRAAPFRCRPPTRHDHPLDPPATCARASATKCTSSWTK